MDYKEWCYYQKGIISTLPPYYNAIVDKKLFQQFKGALYIRWDSQFDQCKNKNYYHVIKDDQCTIDSLPSKTRNMVRRCLKNCEIKLVDYQFIIDHGGYEVYRSEYRRYSKKGYSALPKTLDNWADGMGEAFRRGQEFWAVICESKVVAYSICHRKDAHVDFVTWKVDYENYNMLYPSYGLVFRMCEYYLAQDDIRYVNDGGRSLSQHSSVQEFLIDRFNFRKAYSKLNAKFRWWLYVLLIILSPFENLIKNHRLRSLVRLYKWSR